MHTINLFNSIKAKSRIRPYLEIQLELCFIPQLILQHFACEMNENLCVRERKRGRERKKKEREKERVC